MGTTICVLDACGAASAREPDTAVEFLVAIEVELPPGMDEGARQRLLAAERRRGGELAAAGVIRAIWRVPGRLANRAIWSAPDATALHEAITSLPLSRYFDVQVIPLGRHPVGEDCLGLPPGLDCGGAAGARPPAARPAAARLAADRPEPSSP
ncbi:MAG TPA: muconolactone Delta-isomerase family protein [Acidimicrobiales bacterium]|nr:muconolactone Delta-isomerase family protein [Acidimicrobiales bacterium]